MAKKDYRQAPGIDFIYEVIQFIKSKQGTFFCYALNMSCLAFPIYWLKNRWIGSGMCKLSKKLWIETPYWLLSSKDN